MSVEEELKKPVNKLALLLSGWAVTGTITSEEYSEAMHLLRLLEDKN